MGVILDRKLIYLLLLISSEVIKVCTEILTADQDIFDYDAITDNKNIKNNVNSDMELVKKLLESCREQHRLDIFHDIVKKRKTFAASNLSQHPYGQPLSYHPPHYFGGGAELQQRSCTCDMDQDLRDLGASYFPRYITSYKCKTDLCAGEHHRCRERSYAVRVLKRLDSEPTSNNWNPVQDPLHPPSLRDWIVKIIDVTVACECGPP